MSKIKLLLSLFMVSVIAFAACDDSGSDDSTDNPNLGGARITLPGSSANNASFASAALSKCGLLKAIKLNDPDNIVRYEINFTCDTLNYLNNSTAYPGDTITFTKLFEGRYVMSVTAYDSGNRAIFGGVNDSIDVVARTITDVTVVLRDLIGDSFLVGSPPWAPWGLAYEITGDERVNLTWEDNSVIENGYRVYKMTYPGETVFTLIAELDPDTMFYCDESYEPVDSETWYRVCAYNDYGESNYDGLHFPETLVTRFDAPGTNFDECIFER